MDQAANRQFGYEKDKRGEIHAPSASFLNLINHILSNVDSGTLDAVTDKLPFLSPSLRIAEMKYYYTSTFAMPLFGPDGKPNGRADVQQGSLGDCYVLAALAATAIQDPNWIKQHIHSNANGTYTVTLFDKNGEPRQVVVSSNLPVDHTGSKSNVGSVGNWASIYEKAIAQVQGGYSSINYGGFPVQAMKTIYGNNVATHATPSKDIDFSDLSKRLKAGELVVGASSMFPMDGSIPGSHAFTVISVNEKTGLIALQNPWGGAQGTAQFLVLTFDEFRDNFQRIEGGTVGEHR